MPIESFGQLHELWFDPAKALERGEGVLWSIDSLRGYSKSCSWHTNNKDVPVVRHNCGFGSQQWSRVLSMIGVHSYAIGDVRLPFSFKA